MKNRLREVRNKTNLTLSSYSRMIGIPSDTLRKYEVGEREPKLKTYKISRAFENYIDLKRTLDKACKEITRLRDSEELDKFLNAKKYELVKNRGKRRGSKK